MKKVYFLLFAFVITTNAFAQTIANPGMENWRTNTAGGISGGPVDTIHAPISWYGLDSLIIVDGETYGHLAGAGNDWNAQIFPDSIIKHSGTYSAKIMTLTQDILGNISGVLSNSAIAINVSAVIGGLPLASATSYTGGTPVTERIASVSAWVQYAAGVDTSGAPGLDTGSLTVLVYAKVAGVDSVVGSDTVLILPTSSWTQITAHIKYTDSLSGADTVRILFASSGAAGMDSSTLHVDDVTMDQLTAIKNVNLQSNVKVYPNPTSGMLNIEGAGNAGANFQLFAVNGQLVATKTLTGKDVIDVSDLADGLYFYTISDNNGNVAERGKVSVVK